MALANNAGKIRSMGWRQGKFVQRNNHTDFLEHIQDTQIPENGRILVISQDCDLVNDSYEKEPNAEVIFLEPVLDGKDGNLTHGKNPRQLQLSFDRNGAEIWLRCNIANRYFVPRSIFEDILPDDDLKITDDSLRVLPRWLANRYSRAAFPDHFNSRLAPKYDKCERLFKKYPDELIGLYIQLSSLDELKTTEPYRIFLRGVIKIDDFKNTKMREEMETMMERLEGIINSCDGLEIVDAKIVSEDEFSLHDLREYREWHLDSISLRRGDSAPLPPH